MEIEYKEGEGRHPKRVRKGKGKSMKDRRMRVGRVG